ncbi:helix-turn-helix domain-containing protein [Clostridium botulinum]|nr:helix-turn-helix domain-containing protein [Clostridium botulinum]NFP29967.1 helix-turn-helix domain-containing protein [Clostridium botulinum]
MSKILVYKVKEVAEMINKPATTVRNEIREGKIKSLETQISAFKSVASSLNNIIGL